MMDQTPIPDNRTNQVKVPALDELNLSIAHEISTYLTSILADAENLNNETPKDSELNKMSSHLLGQVQRLQMVTESIMAITRHNGNISNFSLHNIYRPVVEAVSIFKEEASFLGLEFQGPIAIGESRFLEIEMSLFDLTLAFKNLIHNAIKYSFRASTKNDANRYIRITGGWYDEDKKSYFVSIQNYGVGITKEEIENRLVFKPFYRGVLSSDRNRTGSGIGLAYASNVIEKMHHGKLNVESIPQNGQAFLTTFKVILPIQQPKASIERT